MGNVGGRSKGCLTCRKRRVKCDETRPICLRCTKAGLSCEGPKGTVFIQATIVKSRRSQKPVATPKEPGTTNSDSTLVSLKKPQISIPDVRFRHQENEVYICYMRHHLLPNGPIDLSLQDLRASDIISPIPSTNAHSPIFAPAALTFATLFFGKKHHQPHILTQGYIHHSAALQHLHRALNNPASITTPDILVSVLTLATLESLVPTGPSTYSKHMRGLEQLLQLRDPASLGSCSQRTLALYKGVRHMILFEALRTRTPSVLARPEWKAVLRREACSLEDEMESVLHEVLADCTGLMGARDRMLASGRWGEVHRKAYDLLTCLTHWKERWDNDPRNTYDSFPSRSPEEAPPSLRIQYTFQSPSAARIFMFFNTALIHVLQLLSPTTTTDAIRGASLDIARAVPHYLQRKREAGETDFVSLVVHAAVWTAWKALGESEGRWLREVVDGDGFARGMWDEG
ncbi:hypothetical protein BDW02DRAFT_566428 [Decorospora gaudefroyi]|uniref:Zn(2)-C6 fungal-type domain-containing protein n=1 Tax=Decorospora gaudefroyi TaxID=184978 RepID=A0A6A5KRH5_9PLEO|nr:hypothetical protein BDW02DRAFT_566428 [Decorospora gaudefroyi]